MQEKIELSSEERKSCYDNASSLKKDTLIIFSYAKHIDNIKKIIDKYCSDNSEGYKIAFCDNLFENVRITKKYLDKVIPFQLLDEIQKELKEYSEKLSDKYDKYTEEYNKRCNDYLECKKEEEKIEEFSKSNPYWTASITFYGLSTSKKAVIGLESIQEYQKMKSNDFFNTTGTIAYHNKVLATPPDIGITLILTEKEYDKIKKNYNYQKIKVNELKIDESRNNEIEDNNSNLDKKATKHFGLLLRTQNLKMNKSNYLNILQTTEEMKQKILYNFDLNMTYFQSLNKEKFDNEIQNFAISHPEFKEITNLNEYNNKQGIYIMILDEYKQIYVGITLNKSGIKGRIVQHWCSQKPACRLLFGNEFTSKISIDSFRHLDTTRIFACTYENADINFLHEQEENLIKSFPSEFICNRMIGEYKFFNDVSGDIPIFLERDLFAFAKNIKKK